MPDRKSATTPVGGPPPLGEIGSRGATLRTRRFAGLATTWLVAAVLALVHVSVFTLAAAAVPNPVVPYAVMVAPALVALAVRPVPTLRRGYRWLAVWALSLLSVTPLPVLLVGEAWVIGRTWLERGDRPGGESTCAERPGRAPRIRPRHRHYGPESQS